MSFLDKFKLNKVKASVSPSLSEEARAINPLQATSFKWSNYTIDVDPVLLRRGYELYTRDMMSDDQVKSCVMIKQFGVTVGGYSVSPCVGELNENYKTAKDIADFTNYVIDRMQGSFIELLKNIASAIISGFSINEINWDIIEDVNSPYNGMVGIKNIKIRPSHTFTFEIDEYGNYTQIIQLIGGIRSWYPAEKFLIFTNDPQNTGLPQGVSDLRAAYKHWWSKDALMRFRNVAAEKYSSPTVVGTYAAGASKEQQLALLNICRKISVDSAVIKPAGTEIELLETKNSIIMPYDQAIDAENKSIARAIFGQILATDEGSGTGSYAQAKIHRGILGMFLSDLRNTIAEHVIVEQLFKRLIDFNFNSDLYPKCELNPPDDIDVDVIANAMDQMLTQGVINKDEPFIRQLLGFPPKPQELIDNPTVVDANADVTVNKTKNVDLLHPIEVG
jgi:phage gp29-like protein